MKTKSSVFPFAIRKLTTKDVNAYNALLRYAFQVTEQELKETGWQNDEIKQSKFPVLKRADVLGCFDQDMLISQIAIYPVVMNIYGAACKVGFITSVTTYPEYSGRGIMSRLMVLSLKRMREKKQPLALLYPYSIPLYRKFGFEIVSNKISYCVKDRQFPTYTTPGYVRRVDWESEDFMKLHDRFASQTHGCLYRNALAWEEYWRWDVDDTSVAIYYSADDTPLAYMVYMIKDDIMHIKEMIYLNSEGQRGLWHFIQAHESMIDEVRGNTYTNEPLAFYFEDGHIEETICPYIMGRIVDVEQFFLQYNCDPAEKDTCITIDVADDRLKWNNRAFNILFHGGKCTLSAEPGEYHVGMSIATLTTLLLGYKTAAQLQRLGRITGSKASVDRLDDVLLHESPYLADYI